MSASGTGIREGSLQAPSRHPLDWRKPEFTDEAALEKELERGLVGEFLSLIHI